MNSRISGRRVGGGEAFMTRNGTLTRNSNRKRQFSLLRIALVVVTFSVLFVTNPANQKFFSDFVFLPSSPRLSSNAPPTTLFQTSAIRIPMSLPSWLPKYKRGLTNFGIFSLEKRFSGVSLWGLKESRSICRYDSEMFGRTCTFIADYLCHEKAIFDTTDRPFLAYRLLCYLWIANWTYAFCANHSPWGVMRGSSTVTRADLMLDSILRDGLLSVFPQLGLLTMLSTLLEMNIFVFPVFKSLDKVVSSFFFDRGYSNGITNNPNWTFTMGVCTLVFVIGGMSNWLASRIVQKQVVGTCGFMAACLGFQQAVSSRTIFIALGPVIELNPSVSFWIHLLQLMLFDSAGDAVAWLAGGVVGIAFGHYHMDKLPLLGRISMFF